MGTPVACGPGRHVRAPGGSHGRRSGAQGGVGGCGREPEDFLMKGVRLRRREVEALGGGGGGGMGGGMGRGRGRGARCLPISLRLASGVFKKLEPSRSCHDDFAALAPALAGEPDVCL